MPLWVVVDDEPDLYQMVLAMYEILGADGIALTSGEEAIDWIDEVDSGEYMGELPEMALVDLRLPGAAGGAEVAVRFRASPVMGNIPLIIMTGYRLSQGEEQKLQRETNASRIVYKPLPSIPEFDRVLQEVVEGKNQKVAR